MNISVEFDTLRTKASALQSKGEEYAMHISSIHSKMQEISSVWQGEDAQAFLNQANALQPRLQQMKTVIDQYVNVINASANAYQSVMENRISSAYALGV